MTTNECHRDCVSGVSAPVSGSHHSQVKSSVYGPGPAVRECECNERPLRLSLSAASLRTWWTKIQSFSLFFWYLLVNSRHRHIVKCKKLSTRRVETFSHLNFKSLCVFYELFVSQERDHWLQKALQNHCGKWSESKWVSTHIATYHEALDMLGLGKSTYHHIWNNESRPLRALSSQGSSGLMMH